MKHIANYCEINTYGLVVVHPIEHDFWGSVPPGCNVSVNINCGFTEFDENFTGALIWGARNLPFSVVCGE